MKKRTHTFLKSGKVVLEVTSGGEDKTHEGSRGLQGASQVLGMVLDTQEVRVIGQLDNLHTLTSLVLANKLETLGLKLLNELGVDLITMTMTLQHGRSTSIQLADGRVFSASLELGRAGSETHGTAEMGLGDLGHVDDNRGRRVLVQLDRVGLGHTADVTSKLDDSDLETQADSKVRNLLLTSPLGSSNLALNSTVTESTGDKETLGRAKILPSLVVLDRVGSASLGL